jgi:hypothetical protein
MRFSRLCAELRLSPAGSSSFGSFFAFAFFMVLLLMLSTVLLEGSSWAESFWCVLLLYCSRGDTVCARVATETYGIPKPLTDYDGRYIPSVGKALRANGAAKRAMRRAAGVFVLFSHTGICLAVRGSTRCQAGRVSVGKSLQLHRGTATFRQGVGGGGGSSGTHN